MADKPLSDKHARFVSEYRVHRNATAAYTAVYGSTGNSAAVMGRRLLRKSHIAAELQRLDTKQAQDLGIESDRLILEAWNIATADPRELVEFVVGCCRHCYGEGNRYQRTLAERAVAYEKWATDRLNKKRGTPPEFDDLGGVGYDPRKPPLDTCPECVGDGQGRPVLKDTRRFSAAAVSLYAGVKATQHGIEVKMHSKLDALEKLFRHFNLYSEENKDKSPLAEALARFVGDLHSTGAGRAQVVEHNRIRRVK